MVTKEVKVSNSKGLHARPATLLVRKAASFKSDIGIEFMGKKANIKSLIGILSLGVGPDTTVNVIANGTDEKLALEEIVKLIKSLEE
ncbi:HPr family phosphocarrier protein [Clostridium psychrophilum]|uniref:HPr family phosphocarrier protein n=1 Tax=Clostridium psychrophilum TaxID=132926 RepID=UPI001C0CE815|nr:HPr family phosphocarrier protein [Clostridium psychrophilum]MBU3180949.1 HPr family phosphocarrier protein [Clostridium psychrophilum]